jgi:hypothetical protein
MLGIQNQIGVFVVGFAVAWVACFLGSAFRFIMRILSGDTDGSEPGV